MLCNGSKRSPIGLAKNWNPVGNTLDSYTGNIYLSLKNHEFNRLLPPAMKLGQGNIFTGVCDSVHRGVSLSACWDTTIPLHQDQAGTLPPGTRQAPPPPGSGRYPSPSTSQTRQAPPGTRQAPSPKQSILGDTVNEWEVCIRLECNLVLCNF